VHGYNVRKAAQVTAFFAKREGGNINVLKLAKLLYLADREYLGRYDLPILFDRFVSMPHGPVTSLTLNYVNGLVEEAGEWENFITAKSNHRIGLRDPHLDVGALDELSPAELDVLEYVWAEFGHMNPFELRNYTHRNCPEWEDPDGSSAPIPYERVLKFLNKEHSVEIDHEIAEHRELEKSLSAAK
jgi:uncharacterized phage-associated protein